MEDVEDSVRCPRSSKPTSYWGKKFDFASKLLNQGKKSKEKAGSKTQRASAPISIQLCDMKTPGHSRESSCSSEDEMHSYCSE